MKTKITSLIVLLVMAIGVNAQVDRSKMPEPGPSPKIVLEEPTEFELKNGIKVLVVVNRKLPRVSYSLTIDNKPIPEGDKAGVSGILAAMLGNGTTSIPKDEFNDEIDFLGANLNFGSSSAFASGLSKYSDRILELMADAAINPLLTEEEFNKEKERAIENIKSSEKSVDVAASRVGSALSFGANHPYGEFETEETLNNIQFADVLAYYDEYFNPNNAYLVVVGDVKLLDIERKVKTYFENWESSIDVGMTLAEVMPNAQYTQINFVDMPNAVQSNISLMNNVDIKMNDEDYHSVLIANRILGGGFNSYLNMNLREEHGYTYGARSNVSMNRWGASRFTAGAAVRNAVTDSAVVETLKEIKRIKTEPVESKTLNDVKASYVGDFVRRLESPQTVARYALNIELNNLPDDFYTTYLEKINSVSKEDVQRVANKYFKTENARIVVVGKGSEVLENLEKTGLPIMYYDKYANKTEKPSYDSEMPDGVDANSVISAYLEAVGGKAKIDNLNSILVSYEASAMGSTIVSEERRLDGKTAQSLSMNGNPMMAVVLTKDKATMNKNPLPENMANDMRIMAGLFPELNMLNSDKVKLAGVEEVEGEKAYKVEVPGDVISLAYYYSIETGLKIKEVQTTSMQGQTQNQETFLKDYQAYEGIKFPNVRSGSQMGQVIEFKIKEVKINEGVSEADFD
ncbi:insulinase family protein [Winogradskyella sp. DF17]|uniref:Insulinase family protein n=1 Tax=Winogradskyella pelagia TaxID=2819984 RepID=A0ABS3SY27_9FLAO|nr:pitrilysin family protein [Winogradskyella sp. DF17]MBO3115393.1 insulinase family protein [Winogradskyella sp. DF17]